MLINLIFLVAFFQTCTMIFAKGGYLKEDKERGRMVVGFVVAQPNQLSSDDWAI
jgi:hypothetical protein